jgi:hypothetical protein
LVVAAVSLSLLGALPAPASAKIVIKKISFDPSGSDTGANRHLNKEWVKVKNTGLRGRSLEGWKLHDKGRNHTYRFPKVLLRTDEYIFIRTGRGRDSGVTGCNGSCYSYYDFYWGLDNYVWDNAGDVATLRNRSGSIVDRCRYGSSASSPKKC